MFNNIYKGKKVLITGHTGFKGSWLSAWLLQLGADVAGYSLSIPTQPSHFELLQLESRIKHYLGNIIDYDRLEKAFDEFQPEIVFHLAAQPLVRESFANPRETFETNVTGTLNVLEVLRKRKDSIKAAVIITSDKAYDNVEWLYGYREDDKLGGDDPYSGSKGAAELVAKSYMKSFFSDGKPAVATTRAGNVIGGGDWAKDRIVPDIVRSWADDKKVSIRNPHSTRPWQHVLEPLSGYLLLGAHLLNNDPQTLNTAFNFGPDSTVNKTVGQLIDQMQSIWPEAPGLEYTEPDTVRKESNLLKLNCDKANILLEWHPTLNFEDTIRFTAEWYQNYYNKKEDVPSLTARQIREYMQKATDKGISWATGKQS